MEKNKTKKEIRNEIKKQLSRLTREEVIEKSQMIMQRLSLLQDFQQAKRVFIYVAVDCEPDTRPLINNMADSKEVFVPKCLDNDELEAVRLSDLSDLKKGRYGIPEPIQQGQTSFKGGTGSLIIVPGIAFDEKGFRIGRGKGCYDRCLSSQDKATRVWGVGFDLQIVKSIPTDNWDMRVDGVVTEKRILDFFNIY